MIEFNFVIGSFDDAINQIVKWTGRRPVDGVLHFDEKIGKGFVLLAELENNFFVRAWDYILKEATHFRIKPAAGNESSMLMINYLMMPESFLLDTGNTWTEKIRKVSYMNNIIFSSNQTEFSFIVKAGRQAKALDICFSFDWLLRQFPAEKSELIKKALLISQERKPAFFETFSVIDYKMLNEIMEKIFENEWDIIFLKARVLTMLNEFIDTTFLKNKNIGDKASVNTPVMIQVKKRLETLLQGKPPNLKEIARDFSMSESTLKRQFKHTYGEAIYEYFLKMKMAEARKILIESDVTVAHVAYSFGYETASSFNRIFKKQFGISPGSLRSSRLSND